MTAPPEPAPTPRPESTLAMVLVRPQMGENIGMAARAMGNFGLTDLRLVSPRDGWPNPKAVSTAAGADAVMAGVRLYETVREATADCRFVWATTARSRGQGKPVALPHEAMARAWDAGAQGGHAVLFGPERTGLESDEISLADAIVTFPVDANLPSLNLSQAVMLVAYEWRRRASGDAKPFDEPFDRTPAQRGSVHALFEFLETELDRAGYFLPEDKRPIMVRNLRNILHRIGMTEQDARTLRGVVTALAKGRGKMKTVSE